MKIEKWIMYDQAEHCPRAVKTKGGFIGGGWFNQGYRWNDYAKRIRATSLPYVEAIRDSVLKSGSRITGWGHQCAPNGVPFFEDQTVLLFTMRGWGDLMAAIWSEEDDKDYGYMDFY